MERLHGDSVSFFVAEAVEKMNQNFVSYHLLIEKYDFLANNMPYFYFKYYI